MKLAAAAFLVGQSYETIVHGEHKQRGGGSPHVKLPAYTGSEVSQKMLEQYYQGSGFRIRRIRPVPHEWLE